MMPGHRAAPGLVPDEQDRLPRLERLPAGFDSATPNIARVYNYWLLRHEALRYRVGVRDPRRQAVAAV